MSFWSGLTRVALPIAGGVFGGGAGGAAGGALAGMLGENEKAEQLRKHNLAQAEMTKYSPWSGMKGQIVQNNPDFAGGAVKGGLGGYMMGSGLQNQGWTWNQMQGLDGIGIAQQNAMAAMQPSPAKMNFQPLNY